MFGKLTPTDKAEKEISELDKNMFETKKRMMWEQSQLDYYRIRKQYLLDTYCNVESETGTVIRLTQ